MRARRGPADQLARALARVPVSALVCADAALATHWLALVVLYVGLVLTLASTALYVRDGSRRLGLRPSS